jgi:hypothetical protein
MHGQQPSVAVEITVGLRRIVFETTPVVQRLLPGIHAGVASSQWLKLSKRRRIVDPTTQGHESTEAYFLLDQGCH